MIGKHAGIRDGNKEQPFFGRQVYNGYSLKIPWIKSPNTGCGFINIPWNKNKHGSCHCRQKVFPVSLKLQPAIEGSN